MSRHIFDDDVPYLNSGAPLPREAHAIGGDIGEKIITFLIDRGFASPDAARNCMVGWIMREVEAVRRIGVAQGRALERSDNVFKALFPTHEGE